MEMKRLYICIEAILGLSLVLSITALDTVSEIDLADVITFHSTFPNGTYKIPVRDIIDGPSGNAPLPVDMEILSRLPYKVDESSMVAETNRSCHFYVRVPSYKSRVVANRSIGIRFGYSDKINVIPLTDMYMYRLDNQSVVYQIPIRMPERMCSDESNGSCSIVLWTVYYFLTSEMAAKAPFFSDLPVACGPQCNADDSKSLCAVSCRSCDTMVKGDGLIAMTRRFKTRSLASNNLVFSYDTFGSNPQLTIRHLGQTIYDSGCLATQGAKLVNISLQDAFMELRVDVEPDCDGSGKSTSWRYLMPCPKCNGCLKYQCLDEWKAACGSEDLLINYGMHFCDRYQKFHDEFNEQGQRFISCVHDRHLQYVEHYLSAFKRQPDCRALNSKASSRYLEIYKECDFYDTFRTNAPQFVKVIYESPNRALLWGPLGGLIDDCGAAYKKVLCQQYSNLTTICD